MLNERNYIDTALEFERGGNDIKGLQLVISKTAGKVSGEVLTRDGKPAPDSTVVIFPPEPGRWTIASRFIKAVRPDNDGSLHDRRVCLPATTASPRASSCPRVSGRIRSSSRRSLANAARIELG